MTMAVTIPHWVLWVLGIGGGGFILGFAVFGFLAAQAMKGPWNI
jgi:hypothetical protein